MAYLYFINKMIIMIAYMLIACLYDHTRRIIYCVVSRLLSNRTFSLRDGIFAEIKSVSNASHRRVWKLYYIALSSSQRASSKKVDSSRRQVGENYSVRIARTSTLVSIGTMYTMKSYIFASIMAGMVH